MTLGAPGNIPGFTNVYTTWSNVLARTAWRGSRRMRIFSSSLRERYPWPLSNVEFPLVEAPRQIEHLAQWRTE